MSGEVRPTGVRPAIRSDVPALSAVLARAFTDDPVMAWMWPGESARRRGLPRFFATATRHHHLAHPAHGADVALAAGRIGGAILWDPPGRWASSRWQIHLPDGGPPLWPMWRHPR